MMRMPDMLKIGLCQLTSTVDPTTNLDIIDRWVGAAAQKGARAVVFPEAMMACFGAPLAAVAQPLSGPWARAVADIAAYNDVVVLAGMFTPSGDGRVHNTVLITGLGNHQGYNKIHLFDAFGYRESATISAGNETVTLQVDGVKLGVATCYDVRFPWLFQRLAVSETSAVLLPASWGAGDGKRSQWELLVRARALDSGNWILGCDQADPATTATSVVSGTPSGIGYSMVADPFGRVTAQLGPEPGLLTVDIDPAMAMESQQATRALSNRRAESF